MNKAILLLIAGLWLAPNATHGAQTAQARLYCRSLRVQRGTGVDMVGFRWTMDMTTLPVGVNGELAAGFLTSVCSNSTWVELYSEILEMTFPGALVVDIPSSGDANENGFLDFYEVSQAVAPITSPGEYSINGIGNGTFTASWSRDAGSAVGYLAYTIRNPFGGILAFSHAFGWWLSLDDPHDSDHDNIPNFSDDARRPALHLTRGTTNLWLAIGGDAGFVHRVQEITNVLFANWQTATSLLLTNDPQTVSLPLPATAVNFWRVRAE